MADSRPETFGVRMARREKQLVDNSLRNVKKALTAVLRTLVYTTRVDTGRARSNWIVTKSRPSMREYTNFPKGKGGSTADAAGVFAVAKGTPVIASMTPKNTKMFFTNNVPYIGIINDVYGDHMVERAIFVGNMILKNGRFFR